LKPHESDKTLSKTKRTKEEEEEGKTLITKTKI